MWVRPIIARPKECHLSTLTGPFNFIHGFNLLLLFEEKGGDYMHARTRLYGTRKFPILFLLTFLFLTFLAAATLSQDHMDKP